MNGAQRIAGKDTERPQGAGRIVAGRYRLETLAGKGGMSLVWRAEDLMLKKTWAVKETDVGEGPDGDARREAARNEANFVKQFNHSAIPRIVDVAREGSRLYIIMDFIEGETLADRLAREGRQDEADIVAWALQLCDILEYLHCLDPPVVYRDMKPRNVMIDPRGRVHLIDFGISAELHGEKDKNDAEDDVWGTPGFAAPEQLDDPRGVDGRADVYALGATLYTLVTGRHPDDAATHPPRCSQPLARIIQRCMESDPSRRYPSCGHVAYALAHRDDDGSYRRRLVRRMRCFTAIAGTALTCAACVPAFAAAGQVSAARHYETAIVQAQQATDAHQARVDYLTALTMKPNEISPYEGLIDRYKADGIFDAAEEKELCDILHNQGAGLKRDADSWGALCYQIGTLYWHYYAPGGAESESEPQHYAAIAAAEPWMSKAAESHAPCAHHAAIYAGIAEFTTHIVPRVTEGSDRGMYAAHVENLEALLKECDEEGNPVIRLEAASLAASALCTHARAMRGDGVTRGRMNALDEQAAALARAIDSASPDTDGRRDRVLANLETAETAIAQAFCDPGACTATGLVQGGDSVDSAVLTVATTGDAA